jgi:phosphosulfolactate synthase (CoM biosynthesis protein A)
VPQGPTFLKLPARAAKPRSRGITHVLDSGLTPDGTRAFLGHTGHLVQALPWASRFRSCIFAWQQSGSRALEN